MVGGEMWIIANFKSNKTIAESVEWVTTVGPKLERRDDLKIVVCPSFSALEQVKKTIAVGNYPLMVGSQNLSPFPPGAYTGEESAKALRDFISLSILGHSERRVNFHEDDEMVAKKTNQALENNILPLLCIQDKDTVVPEGCKLVAYEPVWAIGSGNPETPAGAVEIAKLLKNRYGEELEVLYGGSVDKDNVKGFVGEQDLAGVLVASASLDPNEFLEIIDACIS